MNGHQGLARNFDLETPGILSKEVNQYGYPIKENEDICAYNLHEMFDVSADINRVPDIEGTLLCNETLNEDSENEEWLLKLRKNKTQVSSENSLSQSDGSSTSRYDSGFNSSQFSCSPPEVPNRPDTPSGSEADVEDSDTEMQQNVPPLPRNLHHRNLAINDIQTTLNDVSINEGGFQRGHIPSSRNSVSSRYMNTAVFQDESVVPSSPTFGASTHGGDDAEVPYVPSDDLASDGSSSDGDNGRHLYSCTNNDHVVPQSYIIEE